MSLLHFGCDRNPFLMFEPGDTIKTEATSPDGRYIAVVFERDMGATTAIATWVSIRDTKESFQPDKQEKLLVIEGTANHQLEWKDNKHLIIRGSTYRAFEQKQEWREIKISYE